MGHNFDEHSFQSLQTLSEVKLAAGIVGYWSGPVFDHLVGVRSFPLNTFRRIQERVARAAYEAGIFLKEELRQMLVHDLGLEPSEQALLATLFSRFAERSVGLKPNNLDPLQQWDNWEELFELATLTGYSPGPELVELAQTSLKRAQEFQRAEVVMAQGLAAGAMDAPKLERSPPGELVISKRSEATGITYFLPDDAVIDQFDDLHSMSQQDLLLLLGDKNGRLEAAQLLLERFGSAVLGQVLDATHEMQAGEIAAIAKFLESLPGNLDGALVRSLESPFPSALYVAAHVLAARKNDDALGALLSILDDPARHGNHEALARALSQYGSVIVPSLVAHIKAKGASAYTTSVLAHVGRRDAALITPLMAHPHQAVRKSARAASEAIKSS